MPRLFDRSRRALLLSCALVLPALSSAVEAGDLRSAPKMPHAPMADLWDGSFHNPVSTPSLQIAKPKLAKTRPGRISTMGAVRQGAPIRLEGANRVAKLKSLIAAAEAGRLGYDAVNYGAKRLPPRRPTEMSVGEILDWVRATPGQPHAIGRYQFIPKTLRSLLKRSGTPHSAQFTPELQDRLADLLLLDAYYAAFHDGALSRKRFMHNLARIWAGLPTSSGRSYYHGYAGNHATISWRDYDRHMAAIFD